MINNFLLLIFMIFDPHKRETIQTKRKGANMKCAVATDRDNFKRALEWCGFLENAEDCLVDLGIGVVEELFPKTIEFIKDDLKII